jgi:hypothetical protein
MQTFSISLASAQRKNLMPRQTVYHKKINFFKFNAFGIGKSYKFWRICKKCLRNWLDVEHRLWICRWKITTVITETRWPMHIKFFHNNLIEEVCFGLLSSLCRSTRLRSITIIVTHGKGITQTIALSLGISKVKTINI